MAQRITDRDIQGRVDMLNRIAKANGHDAKFVIAGAYGRTQIQMLRPSENSGAVWAQSPSGTKRETYEWINAFIDGIAFSERGRF